MSLPAATVDTCVVVTGASSGIGEEIARLLAQRGHNLVIVARRLDRLKALASELTSSYGVEVEPHRCDLASPRSRTRLLGILAGEGRRPIVGLVNNAGIGVAGRFVTEDQARQLSEIELNITALVELTGAIAPGMVARGSGAILNVASLAAFQPLPQLAVYAASKAFVQSFSEAVHQELRGSGVSCTVLCPGPVHTEWAEQAGAEAAMIGPAMIPAAAVAAAAVAGMVGGKRSVVPGVVNQAAALGGRYAPRTLALPALSALLGRETR